MNKRVLLQRAHKILSFSIFAQQAPEIHPYAMVPQYGRVMESVRQYQIPQPRVAALGEEIESRPHFQPYQQITVISSSLGVVFTAQMIPAEITASDNQVVITIADGTEYSFSGGEFSVVSISHTDLQVAVSSMDIWVYGMPAPEHH
jgi:hypothetical protein